MAEQGAVKGEQARRIIREIVVTYRMSDDPKGEDQKFTIRNTGEGEAVDGVIWNRSLMEKLGYLEGDGRCTPVKSGPGKGWETDLKQPETQTQTQVRMAAAAGGDCIWLHDETCFWWEYCGR